MACCPQSLMKSLGHWTLQAHRPRKSGHGARKWLPLHAHFSLHGGAVLPASNLQGWSARSKTRSMLWRRVISAKRPFSVKPQSTNIPHHQLCALPLLCVSASSLSIALCQCSSIALCQCNCMAQCTLLVSFPVKSARLKCTLLVSFPVKSARLKCTLLVSFHFKVHAYSALSAFPFQWRVEHPHPFLPRLLASVRSPPFLSV